MAATEKLAGACSLLDICNSPIESPSGEEFGDLELLLGFVDVECVAGDGIGEPEVEQPEEEAEEEDEDRA